MSSICVVFCLFSSSVSWFCILVLFCQLLPNFHIFTLLFPDYITLSKYPFIGQVSLIFAPLLLVFGFLSNTVKFLVPHCILLCQSTFPTLSSSLGQKQSHMQPFWRRFPLHNTNQHSLGWASLPSSWDELHQLCGIWPGQSPEIRWAKYQSHAWV